MELMKVIGIDKKKGTYTTEDGMEHEFQFDLTPEELSGITVKKLNEMREEIAQQMQNMLE